MHELVLGSLLLSASLSSARAQDIPDLHDVERTPMPGGFAVEDDRWERRGTPIMHAPNAWRKVRLRWTSADAHLTTLYEDNGYTMSLHAELTPRTEGSSCLRSGGAYAHGSAAGIAADWRNIYPDAVGWLGRMCPHADAATMARYRAEFLAAAEAYPAASAKFRSVASAAFGQIARRCIGFAERSLLGEPFREPECIRWSGLKR